MGTDSRPVPGRGRKKREQKKSVRKEESSSSSDEEERPAPAARTGHRREREKEDPFRGPAPSSHRREDPMTARPGPGPGPVPHHQPKPVPSGVGSVPSQLINPVKEEAWNTSLFGCFEDTSSCVTTALVPCVTFGQIAEILDEGVTDSASHTKNYALCMAFGAPCLYSNEYRTKLRSKYRIPQDLGNDCLVHCMFEPCAICQEYRELKLRGVNPSIGWIGNQQGNYQQTMNPPMPYNMRR